MTNNFENFPTKDQIKDFIHDQSHPISKRDIAKSFSIKGSARIDLKNILKDLSASGEITAGKNKTYSKPNSLPSVSTIEIIKINIDGEIIAKPVDLEDETSMPIIYLKPDGRRTPKVGDRVLARLDKLNDLEYEARSIHKLGGNAGKVIGVFRTRSQGDNTVYPAERSNKYTFAIADKDMGNAKDGDFVVAEIQPELDGSKSNKKRARVLEIIGNETDPRTISLISAYNQGIRIEFPEKVLLEATKVNKPAQLDKREDLRKTPLVTIDGADARDFDDAVFAEKTNDGFHLIVAIADVSHYVIHGSPLDKEAFERGNSSYFPDRVFPMLPEELSNGICSLRPHEERACLVAHMWIDESGRLDRFKFTRGLMESKARLTYEQVQAAYDGMTDDVTIGLMDDVINPLYSAFDVLLAAREKRGALDLDLPERKAVIDDEGYIESIKTVTRLNSHRLIEEFMVLANVAAAQALEDTSCIYRIHDKPDNSKLEDASQFLTEFGYNLDKGQSIKPANLNQILKLAAGTDESELISTVLLRTQSRAEYNPENIGHFGLALRNYAHFTSPIRRYADLIVHRSLIKKYNLGQGGLTDVEAESLVQISEHISTTERASMMAERDANDRYTALYLNERIGATFAGRIRGVTNFGLFVALDATGADGLVPIRTLPKDYYVHDEKQHALIGKNTGRVYRLGAPLQVKLIDADPVTNSTVFEVVGTDGAEIPGFAGIVTKKPDSRRANGKRKQTKKYKDRKFKKRSNKKD